MLFFLPLPCGWCAPSESKALHSELRVSLVVKLLFEYAVSILITHNELAQRTLHASVTETLARPLLLGLFAWNNPLAVKL